MSGCFFLKHGVDQTAREACSAVNKAAANKIVKYGTLSASHIFLPVTVENAYLLLFKGGMRSPSWLQSTPCDTPLWSLFLLSLIFMPVALCWWAYKKIIPVIISKKNKIF